MQDLSKLIHKWPSAYVARSEVARFTGGIIQPGTVANLDSIGKGPKGRIRLGRKIAYEVHAFVRWLESRVAVDAEGPMATARRQKRLRGRFDE
jgi:hypothetical protein